MRNQKKIKQEIRTKIMNIVSAPPETERGTGYLKLTDKEIDKIVDLVEQIYQEGFEAGQYEATPQYKKDMEDAYEKGKKDMREEIKKVILDKIDKDYKGRDITIYELGNWLKDNLN